MFNAKMSFFRLLSSIEFDVHCVRVYVCEGAYVFVCDLVHTLTFFSPISPKQAISKYFPRYLFSERKLFDFTEYK